MSRTHFRLREPLYRFMHGESCSRLCAQYFGNHRQDWSQFTIAALEIRRFEHVTFDADSRPFQHRSEIDSFHKLHACGEAIDSAASLVEVRALLPEPPATCDWLIARHRRVVYRLAQRMEREGELAAALTLYGSVGTPDAETRIRIISGRLTGARASVRQSHRAVPHMKLTLAQTDEQRIERRVAIELERAEPGSEVHQVENRLFNALFGLLFWRALFAPVRGAFFHAFQSAPADLHGERFCSQRRELIDDCLQTLRSGEHHLIMRQTYASKAGLSNPWVAWRWLRPATLDRALRCIPGPHLHAIFEWMLGDLRRNTTGFPDLIQYWPDEPRYHLIEVKLGTDRLQDNQRRFLQHAVRHGIPVSVCYVVAPPRSRPARAGKKLTTVRNSPTLSLFSADAAG